MKVFGFVVNVVMNGLVVIPQNRALVVGGYVAGL